MKGILKIENFGPIKHIDIEVSKYNILIGPQGAGKSTIAKVMCIIHFWSFRLIDTSNEIQIIKQIEYLLKHYKIHNYFQENTFWFFEDNTMFFEYKNGKCSIEYKTESSENDCYYIPAERIALPMISESLFELTYGESSLPQYFLKFGKDFVVARKNQQTFNLSILGVEYAHENNTNKVTLSNNKSLLLEETSSAIQSNLPLLIILQFPIKGASLFVIEELELHNYPLLQKKLFYYVVKKMAHPNLKDTYVMLPTHSPYLLSAANNLLFAAKVGHQNKETEAEANKIIDKSCWINKEDFTAYYIHDGKAVSIVNADGLIDENELDGISEDIAGEFDALMELYKPAMA